MKQYENKNLPQISNENFANLFNVYLIPGKQQDDEEIWTYSINKGVYFSNFDSLAPNNFQFYTIKANDEWSTISYDFYDKVELWWLICKVNNITDPIKNSPKEGIEIKVINKDLVPVILNNLRMS